MKKHVIDYDQDIVVVADLVPIGTSWHGVDENGEPVVKLDSDVFDSDLDALEQFLGEVLLTNEIATPLESKIIDLYAQAVFSAPSL